MYKFKIEYDGEPDYELENQLISILDCSGYKMIGSGFNFETQNRDLNFESPNKFVRRSDNNRCTCDKCGRVHEYFITQPVETHQEGMDK